MATGEDGCQQQFHILFLAYNDLSDGLAQCLDFLGKGREVYGLSEFVVFFHILLCLVR